MAGIYLHIPFCRRACTYCDFHFSTSLKGAPRVLAAMHKEFALRADEIPGTVDTIYFGGGTPSLLDASEIARFMEQIHEDCTVDSQAEVTLEANPDDISAERLAAWKAAGIDRLSLGTQSFRQERLEFMGRAHTATQALRSIELIAGAGLRSWSIDLIYGLPGMGLEEWDEQMDIALAHGMPHLSAYCLTVEPRTALAHQVARGEVSMPEDDAQSAQFDRLMARMRQAGRLHYEISNFALPGHLSRHNTSYWEGVPYLGIGPSAHSFDGSERRWNVANNMRYAAALERGETSFEAERLRPVQRNNERILTGLRTMHGVDPGSFGPAWSEGQLERVAWYVREGKIVERDGRLVLTDAGKHFADRIAADLFMDDDR